MRDDLGKRVGQQGGNERADRGYVPRPAPPNHGVNNGYQPETGRKPTSAPASVPKQPSSVQPPKK